MTVGALFNGSPRSPRVTLLASTRTGRAARPVDVKGLGMHGVAGARRQQTRLVIVMRIGFARRHEGGAEHRALRAHGHELRELGAVDNAARSEHRHRDRLEHRWGSS